MANILECPQCGAPLEDINPGVPTIKCKFCHSIVLKPAELSKIVPTDMRDPSAAKILQRSQDLKRMVELARSGKQIEAIRIYREVFDTSLAESKR
ncbi:MAG: hypothetical protein JW704_08950, partial [Anaerolineaceae bacterium]|nr:hypothetical protein [Anaerolineaceae bacterium]MBN2677792.1 hypothetical protein [Anaerolineaceae bacterium]